MSSLAGCNDQQTGFLAALGVLCDDHYQSFYALSVGLGGLCSKIFLICYAAIPGMKLYHAQVKFYYADTMLTRASLVTNVAMGNGSQQWR